MPLLELTESRVQCPWSGSVDFDMCLSCPRLRSIQRRNGSDFVSCVDRTDRMESFMVYQTAPARLGDILRYRRI
jgi:hypothetical protein